MICQIIKLNWSNVRLMNLEHFHLLGHIQIKFPLKKFLRQILPTLPNTIFVTWSPSQGIFSSSGRLSSPKRWWGGAAICSLQERCLTIDNHLQRSRPAGPKVIILVTSNIISGRLLHPGLI